MNNDFLLIMLFFLSALGLLNLWLNLRLIRTIKYLRVGNSSVEQLSLGTVVTDFSATRLHDESLTTTEDYAPYAKVWLFLSSKCDKCKSKLPQIQALAAHTQEAGVYCRILSEEPSLAMKGFLVDTTLQSNTLLIDQQTREQLNPQGASPYYLFVGHDNALQAQGFIGDEDWTSFVEQIMPSSAPANISTQGATAQ